jgi:hypothetical protein
MSERPEDEPIEVEVVRLPRSDERDAPPVRSRLWKAFEPVLAGLFLDVADFLSVNPLLGLVLGTIAGWIVSRKLGLAPQWSLLLILGSAIYCAAPGTRYLPLGTILGALGRFDLDAMRAR